MSNKLNKVEGAVADVKEILQPPPLDHDAKMLSEFDHKVSVNGKLERRIVWNLFAYLATKGWKPTSLDDGDGTKQPTPDAKSVMELLFNLDDAHVYVTNGKRTHWIRFVLGNGCDIISDYSYNEASGFDNVMQGFEPDDFA